MSLVQTSTALETGLHALRVHLLSSPTSERPRVIARVVFDGWPEGIACVCAVQEDSHVAALDASGQTLSDLQRQLERSASEDRSVSWRQVLASLGTPVLARADGVMLGLVLSRSISAEGAALAKMYLGSLAHHASTLLLRQKLAELEEMRDALAPLADIAEISGVLAHEFSNFLNMTLLQISVLEMSAPANQLEEFEVIRRQGKEANNLLEQFHQYRRWSGPTHALDLGELVFEVLQDLERVGNPSIWVCSEAGTPASSSSAVTVLLQTIAGIKVTISEVDLRRLLHFLLRNTARIAALSTRRVVVIVETTPGGVQIRLESSTPASWRGQVHSLLDTSSSVPAGVEKLELAACRSMARRLRCALQLENQPGSHDFRFVVQFPSTRG